jgi:hypothetical protein
VRGTIRDFILPIVEFLGILVPGVIFIFAFIPAAIFPLAGLIDAVGQGSVQSVLMGKELFMLLISPSVGTLFVLAVFSYVVGHLFFRQDPKIPDEKSFGRVKETIKEEGPVRLGEAEKEYNRRNGLPDKYNLEFPYRYLKEYLLDRGMYHLAKMIPWSGNDPETYRFRTKHFINVLKVRLEFLFPYQYLRVQRNEAHVRLMSSMWYAGKTLIWVAVAGSVFGLLAVGVGIFNGAPAWPIPAMPNVIAPLVVLVFSLFLKRYIESFLHYQRIREIVFLLETAYFAHVVYPQFEFSEHGVDEGGELLESGC